MRIFRLAIGFLIGLMTASAPTLAQTTTQPGNQVSDLGSC